MTKKYTTATAFRTGLEERLKNIFKKSGTDLQRLRRQVAFDRLLCRLFKKHQGNLFLKGGYSMELRMELSRATKDIDLIIRARTIKATENPDEIFEGLQKAAQEDLGDFFDFRIGAATLDLEAVPYGGYRFPIEAHLDGRLFIRFPMDIVVSSMVLDPIEEISGEDWLQFAGIETMAFPTISTEQQFAEKIHAYTLPREESENSRVKDLIDLVLLMKSNRLQKKSVRLAIQKIFEYRNTHTLQNNLLEPPVAWLRPFDKLRRESGLEINMDEAITQVATYIGLPVFVREEKAITAPLQATCHFCQEAATTWHSNLKSGAINENEETSDFNCKKCPPFRITGMFIEMHNSKNNSDQWKAWANYLQNQQERKKRILITTKSVLPKDEL